MQQQRIAWCSVVRGHPFSRKGKRGTQHRRSGIIGVASARQQCRDSFFALLDRCEWTLTTGIDQYICCSTNLMQNVPSRFSQSACSSGPAGSFPALYGRTTLANSSRCTLSHQTIIFRVFSAAAEVFMEESLSIAGDVSIYCAGIFDISHDLHYSSDSFVRNKTAPSSIT